MFNVSKIQTEFKGLVALRQPFDTAVDRFLSTQYLASSNLFLDDVEYFRPEYWIDSQSFATATDSDIQNKWDELEKSVIANVMAKIFNKPSYIDRNLIYSTTFDRNELFTISTDTNQFYGYELEVSDLKNIAFLIKNVRIEGKGVGYLTIALYHSSQATAIKSKVVALLDNGTLQTEVLDWVVDMSDTPYKGTYFLGYYVPAGFVFEPYMRNLNDASCMNNITELEIERIENLGTFASLENIDYSSNHNGLNFDITVYEDYTDLIIQNKFLFARVIQLQWVLSILLLTMSSNRSNRNERIAKDVNAILLAVEGQSGFGMQKVTGLRGQVTGELLRIQEEFDSIINGYFPQTLITDTIC